MPDKVKNFINNIGLLCETWIITYNSFREHGVEHRMALEHTKAFMTAFMETGIQNSKEE